MDKNMTLKPENNSLKITPIKIKGRTNLNFGDCLYLACVRQDIAKNLIRIYTFGCPGKSNESFSLKPVANVATFKSQDLANSYEKSIKEIMNLQSAWPLFEIAQNTLQQELEVFKTLAK